ncbi:hypothetical protein D3C73_1430540 [compost metagenome]
MQWGRGWHASNGRGGIIDIPFVRGAAYCWLQRNEQNYQVDQCDGCSGYFGLDQGRRDAAYDGLLDQR